MNRADALVLEALSGGKPDPAREYTLVNATGRSRYELATEGWTEDGTAQDMLVMSRVRPPTPVKVEPEPVAIKAKPAPPPTGPSGKPLSAKKPSRPATTASTTTNTTNTTTAASKPNKDHSLKPTQAGKPTRRGTPRSTE